MIEDEVIEQHLRICKRVCDNKHYNRLNSQRENIKKGLLKRFSRDGYDLRQISHLLDKSDIAIFHYLDTYVMNRGSRPLSWPDSHDDSIRSEILYEFIYNPR